nr:hypothetical protein 24 [Paracoccaceae bacterium]
MSQYNSRYDEYFQNNKDLQDFWNDTSKQGIFEGGEKGKYFENYGKDAAGAEQSFVDGMNKKFGTNNADMRDFTKDQFAQYHYDTYGAKEGRDMKSAQEFLDSKLPKPDNGNRPPITQPGFSIGDGNEFPEQRTLPYPPQIGNNVGKGGNIDTSIGNNNTFGNNATIGNNFSKTTGNGSRSDAKERVESYRQITPPPLFSSSSGSGANINVEVGYGSDKKTQVQGQPDNPSTNITNNNLNVGKRGDMNTSIGNGNTFGMGANIGNDYSVTIGGSGDGLSNMQGLVAYQALNNNNTQRSRATFNPLGQAQQSINAANNLGYMDIAQNAFNLVGQRAQNLYDKSAIRGANLYGDFYNNPFTINPPPRKSPTQPESKVDEILKGFNA